MTDNWTMATKENIFAVARGYHDGLTLISVVYKMISHAEERLYKLKAKRPLPQAEGMIATVREWLEDPTDALAGVRAVAQDTVPSNYTDAQGHMVPASVWAHYLSCAFLAEALKGHIEHDGVPLSQRLGFVAMQACNCVAYAVCDVAHPDPQFDAAWQHEAAWQIECLEQALGLRAQPVVGDRFRISLLACRP